MADGWLGSIELKFLALSDIRNMAVPCGISSNNAQPFKKWPSQIRLNIICLCAPCFSNVSNHLFEELKCLNVCFLKKNMQFSKNAENSECMDKMIN